MAPQDVKYFECSLRGLIIQSRWNALHLSIRGDELGSLALPPLSSGFLPSA